MAEGTGQEEGARARGSHFVAPGSPRRVFDPVKEAAELGGASAEGRGRTPRPDETSVYLRAADIAARARAQRLVRTPVVDEGVTLPVGGSAEVPAAPTQTAAAPKAEPSAVAPSVPATPASARAPRPDETAVFLAAAASMAPTPTVSSADETGVFLAAALRQAADQAASSHVSPAPRKAASSAEPAATVAADDDWLFSGAAPVMEGALDRTGVQEALTPEPVNVIHPGDIPAVAPAARSRRTGAQASAHETDDSLLFAADLDAIPADGDDAEAAVPVAPVAPQPDENEESGHDEVIEQAEKSSNMVSVLVIISRVTGFFRTAVQAWAIGAAMLASCYTIANQLPNMLYELVVGGMLITAFLPVYVKVRDKLGREGASEYASNLLSILLVLMTAITVVSFIFAAPIVWTQSAGAAEGFDSELAVWFFRWFACEIVLYALSSVYSGVLNAERDYLVSNAAPIYNNVAVILSFVLYGALTRTGILTDAQGMVILAIGNPLGVALQVLVQVPALRRHGVRFRLRVNLHDPALRETLSIGLPTLVVTLAGYPTLAVMSSCAMQATNAGAAIMYYSRVWYVLPYSIFAVPISVTMFTEMSRYFARDDMDGFSKCFSRGASKIVFTVIPFTMFLMVFSQCLIAILASGRFSQDSVGLTALYLACLAASLPFHCMSIYLQKACSALMSMNFFALAVVISAVAQIAFCIVLTPVMGIAAVALSQAVYYAIGMVIVMVRLRGRLGRLGLGSVASALVRSLIFGGLGSLVGWGILQALAMFVGPLEGALRGVLYACAAGIPAVLVTFGLAYVLGKSDAPFFDSIFGKLLGRKAVA